MLRKILKIGIIGGLLILMVSCITFYAINTPPEVSMHPLQQDIESIRRELAPLDFQTPVRFTPALQAYLEYYHLRFDNIEYNHMFGMFSSGAYTLASHVFLPVNPQGTVFFVHGYIDHTGLAAHLIQNCLQQGLAVAVYDLPGHGLSSGERISIEDFSDYTTVLHDFLSFCQPHVPRPYHIVSHSTGSAIVLDYLAHAKDHHFEGIVFLAPLVRHVYWYPAKITHALGRMFGVKTVPRRYSEISSSPEFLEFLKNDPLQTVQVPTQWIGALYDWERQIQQVAPLSESVLIIQGTNDTVVDGEYNIPFLQQKIEGATVVWIHEARHHLLNEQPAIRQEVFDRINRYLRNAEAFTTNLISDNVKLK